MRVPNIAPDCQEPVVKTTLGRSVFGRLEPLERFEQLEPQPGLFIDPAKATTLYSARGEAWKEKASERKVAVTCIMRGHANTYSLLFVQDKRFAIHFEAQAHCLLPEGLTPRSLSTMHNLG